MGPSGLEQEQEYQDTDPEDDEKQAMLEAEKQNRIEREKSNETKMQRMQRWKNEVKAKNESQTTQNQYLQYLAQQQYAAQSQSQTHHAQQASLPNQNFYLAANGQILPRPKTVEMTTMNLTHCNGSGGSGNGNVTGGGSGQQQIASAPVRTSTVPLPLPSTAVFPYPSPTSMSHTYGIVTPYGSISPHIYVYGPNGNITNMTSPSFPNTAGGPNTNTNTNTMPMPIPI